MVGSKPCLVFSGDLFETDSEYARLKNVLLGEPVCVCVCVCVCTCVYVCVRVHMHAHAHSVVMCLVALVSMYVCMM